MITPLLTTLLVLASSAASSAPPDAHVEPEPAPTTASARLAPRPPERSDPDEALLRNLDVLQQLELLDHLELFDEGR